MRSIDPASQSVQDNYKLLIGSIVPRPIAFVTTLSSEGVLNAAPFSFFNIVTANPPMVAVSVQRKPGGVQKDTARNAVYAGQFVVHISDESYIEAINVTAANLPPEESEVELSGLTAIASERVKVPGIAEARIRMECVLEQALPLGGSDETPACDLLIGRVVHFHVADKLYENGRINAEALQPVSRLAGNDYAKLGQQFTIERPI